MVPWSVPSGMRTGSIHLEAVAMLMVAGPLVENAPHLAVQHRLTVEQPIVLIVSVACRVSRSFSSKGVQFTRAS